MRDAKEDVDKVCYEAQKTSDNAGGKLTCRSLLRLRAVPLFLQSSKRNARVRER